MNQYIARGITVAIAAHLLVGCASFPKSADTLPAKDEVSAEMSKAWASLPSLRYVAAQTGSSIRKRSPLPLAIANAPLKFSLSAKTTVSEIVGAMEAQGIRIVLRASAEKRDEKLQLLGFDGKVGEFLEALSISHDLDFEWMDGVILVRQGVRYMVSVPQNKELMGRIPAAIEALGAKNVKADLDSGLVTYEAAAGISRDVDLYLNRMASNASMVALQVAVIDVRLNRDRGFGFDWNEFTTKWGTALGSTLGTPSVTPAPPGAVGPTTPAIPSTTRILGSLAKLSGNGLSLQVEEAKFSLAAAVKLLSTYGQAKTTQDVLISTLGGAPVKISSGTQIPYVSGLGAVTAAGGAVSGSVNTSTVKSGLSLDITPRYDAAENLVITDVKAKLSSLVRFRELSAGNSVGTLSQPEIQELEFENISRLRPGEIVMLGGISYDMVSENYTSLAGMEKAKVGSEVLTTNRHAIFIVIRPSVTVFTEAGGADGAQVAVQ
ncbi:type II secretion system protein GspD [Acidovorax sp.]|uniref:type II secretion system protein GspD n=1 Tax=Acidovorax sp. TaxID=1872122 RepID=UPI00391F412F